MGRGREAVRPPPAQASAVGELPAGVTGGGERLLVLLLGEAPQALHGGVGGGEGQLPADDGQFGLPEVAEDPLQVRGGVVPALAGVPGA